MKQIQLTKGKVTMVDNADYNWLSQWKWHAKVSKHTENFYAAADIRGKTVRMSRLILGLTDPKIQADHKDHDTLNNQRSNLRPATASQNNTNKRSKKGSSSKYLGVSVNNWYFGKKEDGIMIYKNGPRWSATIRANKKQVKLGNFPFTEEGEILAAKSYDAAAKIYHGEWANLNFK